MNSIPKIDIRLYLGRTIRGLYGLVQPLIKRVPWLRKAIKKIAALFPSLLNLASYSDPEVYARLSSSRTRKMILIDVTHMATTELNTGIQRVVRALMNQFDELSPDDVDVEPVVLTAKSGFWHFEFLNSGSAHDDKVVVPREGDIFLGLDLNAQIIAAEKAGLFDDWKSRGARIVITVHDILPIVHPEWWADEVSVNHEKWLRSALKSADTILSVSKTTQDAVKQWCLRNDFPSEHLQFEWFHLGADFNAANPSKGFPEGAEHVIAQLKANTTFLSVGTIEPRKGYEQCLDAFEVLWKTGFDCNLVFVGKEGWMVDRLIERFKYHPELNKKFFWLDGISDEFLDEVYVLSNCLIAPSNGEGFGIPLIEAARHGLPIIARDIPIFREVVGNNADYFKGQSAEDLADTVKDWLGDFEDDRHITSSGMKWHTWRDSAIQIQNVLRF